MTTEELYGEDVTPPVSTTGLPCMDATWVASDAEARAKLLTTKVLSCANLAALGASDTFAGLIELASNAEAQAKALATRALTPANLAALDATTAMSGLVEKATTAELEAGTPDKYLDAAQMPLRWYAATQVLIGGDFTGNARGPYAIDIQTKRGAPYMVASGQGGVCLGSDSTASNYWSTAIGNAAVASGYYSAALGSDTIASGFKSVAAGYGSNASGDQSLAFGNCTASGIGTVGIKGNASGNTSIAIGYNSTASGDYSLVIGSSGLASATRSLALGYQAAARIVDTTNICAPLINSKDNGEAANIAFRRYAGAEVVLMSKEVDLEAVADQTLTLPAGSHFFPNEVGVIVTTVSGGIITQPTVRFGWTGTLAGLLAAIITTALSATFARERYTSLLSYNGLTSLTAGVTIAGSGGTYLGRFYWKGMFIEDE